MFLDICLILIGFVGVVVGVMSIGYNIYHATHRKQRI